MPTDLESPAPPPRPWSWKKILPGFLGILTVFLIVILAYDQKLEPYDDLKPTRTSVPDATTNGFLFLKEKWAGLPEPSSQEQKQAQDMVQGTAPWDAGILTKMRPGREHAAADLKAALAMPEWLVPPTLTYKQLMAEPFHPWIIRSCRYLSLEASAAVRAGDFPAALALLQDLQQLSRRHIEGSGNLISYLVGVSLQTQAAALCCDLLDQGQPDAAQVEAMAKLWQTEPDAISGWDASMRSEMAVASEFIGGIKSGTAPEEPAPWFSRLLLKSGLLLKKNQTLNHYHRRMRNLMQVAYQKFPSMEAAGRAGLRNLPERSFLGKMVDPNFVGSQLVAGTESYVSIAKSLRKVFFEPRAIRVRLALHRWRATHPDQWPATLEELVPDFLAAVPEDPWNGNPLLWDASAQIIYAVGSDWKPDLPAFSATRRSWFADDAESPGLRLTLPPPPPIPVAPVRKSTTVPAPK